MGNEEYGKTIKILLAKTGMKQKDLADKVGVSPALVTQWVKGWIAPNVDHLLKMSKLFNVSVDYILTGKTLKTITEGLEQTEENQYDFYKYVTKGYDLRAHPELIRQHFEFMVANPEKCREIPKKHGDWNIARRMDRVGISRSGHGASAETSLKMRERAGIKYIFDIICTMAIFGKKPSLKNHNFGHVTIQIEFDDISPHYCAIVNFHCKHSLSTPEDNNRSTLLEHIVYLICKILETNGFGATFLIAGDKNTPMVIRECMTRKIHYFVIPKTENNMLFWKNPLEEVTSLPHINVDEGYEI